MRTRALLYWTSGGDYSVYDSEQMAIIWSQVVAFAAELSTIPVLAQDLILEFVNVELNLLVFGGEGAPKLTLARIYYAAHLGTITKRTDNKGGPVVAESEGGVRTQYGLFSPTGSDPLLDTTGYGKAFRQLIRSSPIARAPRVI